MSHQEQCRCAACGDGSEQTIPVRPADANDRSIPVDDCGRMFLHCRKCLRERPENVSPADWARLSVAFTNMGIQVRCERHGCNVAHVDFEGAVHPYNSLPS